ncbi:MAG: hypothetical protein ACYDDI_11575 [Candidatus Acidiferrales bacterium]
MKWLAYLAWLMCASASLAQTGVQPVILSKTEADGQVTVVEVRPHFVTAVRMPETVTSVAVGDPALFQVEHSDHEPRLVFVKALTDQSAETNLLISTESGGETSLLIVSHGNSGKDVDLEVKYRRSASFLIAPDYSWPLVGETVPAGEGGDRLIAALASPISSRASAKLASPAGSLDQQGLSAGQGQQRNAIEQLLSRQEHAPLPTLYGGRPDVESSGGDRVRAGVSEVIDDGQKVIVLFSAVNPTRHAILLVPPQVQVGGKTRQGKIFKHWRWTTAEQLPVEEFQLSTRRLAPRERADGIVVFERPPYKQSTETLLLQIAEAGAVDKPALAPIGFGINKIHGQEVSDGTAGK